VAAVLRPADFGLPFAALHLPESRMRVEYPPGAIVVPFGRLTHPPRHCTVKVERKVALQGSSSTLYHSLFSSRLQDPNAVVTRTRQVRRYTPATSLPTGTVHSPFDAGTGRPQPVPSRRADLRSTMVARGPAARHLGRRRRHDLRRGPPGRLSLLHRRARLAARGLGALVEARRLSGDAGERRATRAPRQVLCASGPPAAASPRL